MYEIAILLDGIWHQFRQIAPYWASGLVAGSLVSVYLSDKITEKMARFTDPPINDESEQKHRINASNRFLLISLCLASILGIISPLCMYGTVPIIAALGRKGVPSHLLASFMVSSILLNPNILILSFALGPGLAFARLGLCFLSGILAGALSYLLFQNKKLFSLDRFTPRQDKKKNGFFIDLLRAFRITSTYLLIGLTLAAVFNRYVPPDLISGMFGSRRGLGILFATTLSIPLYACGGGTIPLIKAWLQAGMGAGDAMAFMLAGPALKINTLSALMMIFSIKRFFMYLLYCITFAVLAGLLINIMVY